MAELKFVRALPKAKRQTKTPVDPKEHVRKKFAEGIQHQIALAKNPKYTIEKTTYKGGQKQTKKAAPRQWWQTIDDKIYVQVRYGNKLLQLKGGNIAVCDQKELVQTLQAIHEKGTSGEWDAALLKAAPRQGRKKASA